MQETLEKIKKARQAIWTEEPAEVKRLPSIKGAWNQGASTVLFAATKLATLITFLNHMRGVARQGDVDLETMKRVTRPYLEFHAGVYGNHYQFADTAQIVRLAAEALPEVERLEDYATLMGELSIYLNRLDYWVDTKIPWARFGQVFEQGTAS
ncbi:MAG: hypothetical protein Kow0063_17280 [Anaerolineae bacterium]